MNDLKFALRQLVKTPGFTAVAVLTLALGIGANTAIFSAVNALILQTVPYKNPNRLVEGFSQNEKTREQSVWVSPPDFVDLKNQSTAFEEIAGWRQADFIDRQDEELVSVKGAAISTNLFLALGVQPFLGRTFLPDEVQTSNSQVVILSHGFWQRRFGADRKIIGQTVRLSPNPREAPGSKLQASGSAAGFGFGIWALGFLWSLEIWDLGFCLPLTTDHGQPTTNNLQLTIDQ